MPMPTSPAYCGWRLSKVSWKRKPQPTGSCQFSAKRCSAAQDSASQPLPPTIISGRVDSISSRRTSRSAPGAGQACAGTARGSTGAEVGVVSMSSGSTSTTGPGRPCSAVWKARADVLGQAVGVVHLADPLGHAQRAGAEHLAVVEFLERLAVALVAGHLADEQDHRRGVLEGGVHADAGIGRARPAGDEADARSAAQLALCFGHEGRAALLAAGDEADAVAVLVKAVEHGQVTLAGHAEAGVDALRDQGFDQHVACGAGHHRRVSGTVGLRPTIMRRLAAPRARGRYFAKQ